MDNESKKPCAPVEEEGRDYDALGLFRREGDNETLMAAMGLWEFLPAWMDARRMALVDPDYNRKISAMVADLAGGHEEPDRATFRISDGMQLGVHAALGSADLASAPPFFTHRLEAVRCAFR